jgi:hypothetical protein
MEPLVVEHEAAVVEALAAELTREARRAVLLPAVLRIHAILGWIHPAIFVIDLQDASKKTNF